MLLPWAGAGQQPLEFIAALLRLATPHDDNQIDDEERKRHQQPPEASRTSESDECHHGHPTATDSVANPETTAKQKA